MILVITNPLINLIGKNNARMSWTDLQAEWDNYF